MPTLALRSTRDRARRSLVQLGRRTSVGRVDTLRSVLGYLELGRWLADLPPDEQPADVGNKIDVFEYARRHVVADRLLYLEFGGHPGRNLRWWAEQVRSPRARFVAFDGDGGQPEPWSHGTDGLAFLAPARSPIGDPRVSTELGWFEDVLSHYIPPDHDQLLINIDGGGRYFRARTVLAWARPYLQPGALLYFNRFVDRDHEMRAFFEFAASYPRRLQPLALSATGQHLVVRVR